MANYESVQNDLTTLLATTLTAEGVDLIGENARLSATQREPDDEWATAQVLDAALITEIGGRTSFNIGRLMVEIYTELGRGSKRSAEISDAIASAFQGVRVGAASCYEVERRPGLRDPGGAFWHSGCSVRFRWQNAPS